MSRATHNSIRWFADSPDPGSPRCICSYCGERIEQRDPDTEEEEEVNADEGCPIMLWTNGGKAPCLEARFHPRCFDACLELGLVSLNEDGGEHQAETHE